MNFYRFFFCLFFISTSLALLSGVVVVTANVVISEIAAKGTADDVCNGSDWVELYNNGVDAVDVSGWILHDDKGPEDEEAFTFPYDDDDDSSSNATIAAGEFLVLCMEQEDDDFDSSPQFGIGDTDTITLLDTTTSSDSSGGIVVAEVALSSSQEQEEGSTVVTTFALDEADGTFKYTTTSTPGLPNTITAPPPVLPSIQERLAAQNALGTRFFNMDDNGLPVADGMPAMVDFHIEMTKDAYQDLLQNATHQLYVPFTSARVVMAAAANGNESLAESDNMLAEVSGGGRIRTKGQYTLITGVCLGSPALPFMIDFNNNDNDNDDASSTTAAEKQQTMFGIERLYLRNHMDDWSYMREWTSHRMLARFGLPHLRSRTVRFYINNNPIGLYTLMEAVNQDYVFYRSFPTVNLNNFALYKVKTISRYCGQYDDSYELTQAQSRLESDTESTPPYSYEDGNHREPIPVLGMDAASECNQLFRQTMGRENDDVLLAYLRYNQDCGTMLVEEGLIDRDLGNSEYDTEMAQFINNHLAGNVCDEYCQNSNLANEVKMDNWLKNFAVYAVALIQDSVSFCLFRFVCCSSLYLFLLLLSVFCTFAAKPALT
jgi:CotH kinase protein/Lamin Tail Domain